METNDSENTSFVQSVTLTIVIHLVNLSRYKIKRLIPCHERRGNLRLLQHQMQGPSMPILVFCWQLTPFRIIAEIRPNFKKNHWDLQLVSYIPKQKIFMTFCCSFLSTGTKDKTLNWWLLLQLLSYALKMAITVSASRGSYSFTYNFSEVRSFIHLSWRYNRYVFLNSRSFAFVSRKQRLHTLHLFHHKIEE